MGAGRYDVIVVGARVAGAATAMLLARQGLRVLVVDRVSFPCDTISSHQLQVPGAALLRRWGLLDKLTAAGTPPTRGVRFDVGDGIVLEAHFPAYEGVDALYSPRRTLLDATLVEAARAAGAEVRENFRVTQLMSSDGRVTGIRGNARGRPEVTETASLVIGADGKRSLVAGAVAARRYRERPVRSFASYTYWSGVPLSGGELYQRPGRAVAVFPTNDDLTMVYVAAPMAEFASARADLDGHYLRTLDLCGDLGERVRSGTKAERLRTTPDQPNTFRRSHGPGWALAGDAGVVMDSISAQGMTNALRDASYLSAAVAAGLGGTQPLAAALHDHQRRRDRAIRGMYDFTVDLAAFPRVKPAQRQFLAAVAADQQETDRFLGAFAGIVPPEDYFTLGTAVRLLGSHGIRMIATAAANHLPSGMRRRDPSRAGARASRVPPVARQGPRDHNSPAGQHPQPFC
ncbi:MAG: FAD-dependent monooxygenase [Nocardiopsaceae bacterium]|jgi:2-polyprenyl-6-methoxyphenol hydroxylase-like FAD-dependent oxidoreductase|nr:FAD-dependent monooxygenase [Nocardiopsaceae bacterium]